EQSVTLDSANDFKGTVSVSAAQLELRDTNSLKMDDFSVSGSLTLMADSINLSAVANLGLDGSPLSLNARSITAVSEQGAILVSLKGEGDFELHLTAKGDVEVERSGVLKLVSGSTLTSQQGEIAVISTDDLWVSGLTMLAEKALLRSENGAIKATHLLNAAPLAIQGELTLNAAKGIGGFDYERVLIDALSDQASVNAYNSSSGDVVIGGMDGLTVDRNGIRSDANGWVALLSGTGTIVEQGVVSASSKNVARITGANWMSRADANASILLNDFIDSGTLAMISSAATASSPSPLAQMNQRLADGWNKGEAVTGTQDALSSKVTVVSAKARAITQLTAPVSMTTSTVSVMSSPQTTAKLLEMAMTVTQQGHQLSINDTESLSSWANRTSPTVISVEPNAMPAASVPVLPNAVQPSVPTLPQEAPTKPNDNGTSVPAETSPASPTSEVRWLLPPTEFVQTPAMVTDDDI
ncbi:MAG: hypothetical protein RLZZ484_238, partial [Pseudomonadota bacterium]